MIHCDVKRLYDRKYVFLWMLLSFKAGFLNAAGFLATGYFVSHVTGFGSMVGVSLAHEEYVFGIELLVIPFAFIFGAMIPPLVLERDYQTDKVPVYPLVQIMITIILGLILFLGISGELGPFSAPAKDSDDILLIGLLCMVCGMKNGLTTWATYGKIRTTHLTGLATDIGLNLPKLFRPKEKSRFPEERKINTARLATLISFSIGSLVSAFLFPKLLYVGFVIPFAISIVLSGVSIVNYKKNIRMVKAMKLRKIEPHLRNQSA